MPDTNQWIVKSDKLEEVKSKIKTKYGSQDKFAASISSSKIDSVKKFLGTRGENRNGVDKHIAEKFSEALDFDLEIIAEKLIVDISNSSEKSLLHNLSNNYREIFKQVFDEKQKQLTSNSLIANFGSQFDLDDVYISLGLEEIVSRKVDQNNTSKQHYIKLSEDIVSKQAHDESLEQNECETFENDDVFLNKVLRQKKVSQIESKRIAIIGEPGSGKTSRLQKIGCLIFENSNEEVAIFISSRDLKGKTLEEYLLDDWLKNTLSIARVTPELKKTLVEIFKKRKVFLLLDGVDEIASHNYLFQINSFLQGWINKANIVITCRTNSWNIGKNELFSFKAYENFDFKDEQIKDFIDKFFDLQPGLGKQLNAKLTSSENKKIKKIVKNPLRLTLLCYSWQKRQGQLPNTKIALYKYFVDRFYDWKEWEWENFGFNCKFEAIYELNHVLGELAKQSLDDPISPFRMTHNRVCKIFKQRNFSLDRLKMALDIGWVQCIKDSRENLDETVYSFLHPTFQEYFAALAIEDWDYFIPRDHNNQNPQPVPNKKYRSCQNKWESVILLWLENQILNNYNTDDIEGFFKHLDFFQDGINNSLFFYQQHLLDLLITILKEIEYKSYYYHEMNPTIDEVSCTDFESRELDLFWMQQYISEKMNSFAQPNNNDIHLTMLEKLGLSYEKLCHILETNQKYVDFGFSGLEYRCLDYSKDSNAINKIFISFNDKYKLNYESEQEYYEDLQELMLSNQDKKHIILGGYYCLLRMNDIGANINIAKHFIEDCELPFVFLLYKYSKQISYEDFYQFWHGSCSTIQKLEKHLCGSLPQLKETKKAYPISINLQYLHKETDVSAIAQEFCNQIYQNIPKSFDHIPIANHAPQLKRLIIHLKNILNKENIALVLWGEDPYSELEIFCRRLSSDVNIAWITDRTLEQPLRGFPTQANLDNILQNWLDEII